jgi:glycerate kinase
MAQALGVRLTDASGADLGPGGKALLELRRIDLSERDPRIKKVSLQVICNAHNVLCGERGVSRVFGRQKGASEVGVQMLSQALERYADIIERDVGVSVRHLPGSGASGGLGAGFYGLMGAELVPRSQLLDTYFDLDARIAGCDLVVTAEGGIEAKSAFGKIPLEVGRRASGLGVPVILLVGSMGEDIECVHAHGISACFSIQRRPCTLDQAMSRTAEQLEASAEHVMRVILAGARIGSGLAHRAGDCHAET